jgi:hypothetical protein
MAGIEKHTRQQEHDEPENLVESPGEAERAARSLEDEVDSNATLEGYFAMNNVRDPEVQEALDLEKKKKEEKKNG